MRSQLKSEGGKNVSPTRILTMVTWNCKSSVLPMSYADPVFSFLTSYSKFYQNKNNEKNDICFYVCFRIRKC